MFILFFFFFNDTAPTEIYTLSLHDALPISLRARRAAASSHSSRPSGRGRSAPSAPRRRGRTGTARSEEHTSELQSRRDLVCRLLLEKKKKKRKKKKNNNNIDNKYTIVTSRP